MYAVPYVFTVDTDDDPDEAICWEPNLYQRELIDSARHFQRIAERDYNTARKDGVVTDDLAVIYHMLRAVCCLLEAGVKDPT